MKSLSFAGALAIAMTFGTTLALAQTGPTVGDGKNSITPAYPYNSGGAAAQIGDGSNTTKIPTTTPGYNVGTGSAQVGDGSNTKPVSTLTPGYSVGVGTTPKGPTSQDRSGQRAEPGAATRYGTAEQQQVGPSLVGD